MPPSRHLAASPVQPPDQAQSPQHDGIVEIFPERLSLAGERCERTREVLSPADAEQSLILQRPVHQVLYERGRLTVLRTERLTDQSDGLIAEHRARPEQHQARGNGGVLDHTVERGLLITAS